MQDKFKIIERKRVKAMIPLFIGIVMLILTVIVFFALSNVVFIVFFILATIAGVVFSIFYKDYRKYYKLNFVAGCIEDMFDKTEYFPDKCISPAVIKDAHIVKMGNTYAGDDYLTGEYRGIRFTQSDLTIQQVTSNGKNTHTSTYFKGKWIFFDFNKDFKESVIIRERSGSAVMAGNAGDKVEFESVDFNKEFRVYSNDQHTAFYLMTPQFLLSLRKLRDKTHGQLLLGFVDGKLHIAVNSGKNSLEPRIFNKISENYVEEVRADMRVITDFIDELIADKYDYRNTAAQSSVGNVDEPLFEEL